MKLCDYFYDTPDRQWEYASQLGIRYADGRMVDGQIEEIAGSYERLKAMKEHSTEGAGAGASQPEDQAGTPRA